ncbi:MAG: carbamoyltransferase N-terminal domain-containing protein [Candidatus Nanoarchaeia archaeon]|nr:carbamoyltransferase N-terminal domain-containing protein [Candidatus Nanoarchaeia archaeon]
MDYFTYSYKNKMPSKKLCLLLDGSVRKPEEEITQRHKDIAAALQLVYEDALFKIINYVHKETKSKNLVIAGGCALNSVANGKILRNSSFKNIWSQPDPGDGGTSIGAALFVWNALFKQKKRICSGQPLLRSQIF